MADIKTNAYNYGTSFPPLVREGGDCWMTVRHSFAGDDLTALEDNSNNILLLKNLQESALIDSYEIDVADLDSGTALVADLVAINAETRAVEYVITSGVITGGGVASSNISLDLEAFAFNVNANYDLALDITTAATGGQAGDMVLKVNFVRDVRDETPFHNSEIALGVNKGVQSVEGA